MSELPSNGVNVDVNTMVAIPGKKKGQFKLYTWFDNEWVFTASFDKSDFDLKDLKDAYDDLSNAVKKLTRIAANTESDGTIFKAFKNYNQNSTSKV